MGIRPTPGESLTLCEKGKLAECEVILEKGLGTFYDVGNALITIRDNRLYRLTHSTFEQYCHERWGMGRSYACRVIGASERLRLLPPDDGMPRPATEFQMRPFLKLSPQQFPHAWKETVKTAKEGKVTGVVIKAVVRKLLPHVKKTVRVRRNGGPGMRKVSTPKGQVLVLLGEAKKLAAKGETDRVLEALERIENLLFET